MKKMSKPQNPVKGTIHAVPLHDAQARTFAWQSRINPTTNEAFPKSFRLSKVDFEQIFSNPEVINVRVYPAVEVSEENGVRTEYISILVVGVDRDDADIIDPDSEASGIYDVAFPCPNTCGTSPLYKQS